MPVTNSNLLIIIILFTILINIGTIFTHYFFGKDHRNPDLGLLVVYGAGVNESRIGNASLSYPGIQNNVILSEEFEGPVKIINNESIPSMNENESLDSVNGSGFRVEKVFTGIASTSNMAFIGPDDILFSLSRIINLISKSPKSEGKVHLRLLKKVMGH